jgi:hypothetical protein
MFRQRPIWTTAKLENSHMCSDIPVRIRRLIIWHRLNCLSREKFNPIARCIESGILGDEVDPRVKLSDVGGDIPLLDADAPHMQ